MGALPIFSTNDRAFLCREITVGNGSEVPPKWGVEPYLVYERKECTHRDPDPPDRAFGCRPHQIHDRVDVASPLTSSRSRRSPQTESNLNRDRLSDDVDRRG